MHSPFRGQEASTEGRDIVVYVWTCLPLNGTMHFDGYDPAYSEEGGEENVPIKHLSAKLMPSWEGVSLPVY
jgi:hypothetical protein